MQLSCSVFLLQMGPQQPEDDSHEIQYVPCLHVKDLCFSNSTDTEGLLENARLYRLKMAGLFHPLGLLWRNVSF